jgi:CheY-like chemotaxis protein
VVDDDVDAAETVAKLLRHRGHDARAVFDGPAALAACREQAPDVVLLDIGLQGMDGYAVAAELRRTHGDAFRLVALTGHGREEDRRRTRDAGFDDHLVKPVGLADLLRVLSSAAPRG